MTALDQRYELNQTERRVLSQLVADNKGDLLRIMLEHRVPREALDKEVTALTNKLKFGEENGS